MEEKIILLKKFFHAIRQSDNIELQRLIYDGEDVNTSSYMGHSPLIMAIEMRNKEAVRILIKAGANVTVQGEYDVNPLAAACAVGDVDILEMLFDAGADPRSLTHGGSVISLAAMYGKTEVIDVLVARNADINHRDEGGYSVLTWCMPWCKPEVVKKLLELGANPNISSHNGHTALSAAVWTANSEKTKILLDAGADPDVMDKECASPILFMSIMRRYKEITRLLLNYNVNVNVLSKDGYSPLSMACAHKDTDIVALLLNAGAEVDSRDGKGCTPLWIMSSHDNVELMSVLIARGADIDARDNRKNTPLIVAARLSKYDAVKCLLAAGAKMHLRNTNGESARDWAVRSGPAMVELFDSSTYVFNSLCAMRSNVKSVEDEHGLVRKRFRSE